MSALSLHIESTDSMVIMTYSPKAVMIQLQVAVYSTGRELDKRNSLTIFHHGGENCLVNSLFHSHSTCWNVGKPIRLHCISDIIRGNNGDQAN